MDLSRKYVITTQTGHLWLIEDADDMDDAIRQYEDEDAEPWIFIEHPEDADQVEYLREMGQAS